MPTHYKSMIVVLVLASFVFVALKPAFLPFMSEQDYTRRRNLWLGITLAAYLSPSIWLYVAIAVVMTVRVMRKDSNPLALYALLMVAIPPVIGDLPTFGLVGNLFNINQFRLVTLMVLVPCLLAERGRRRLEGPLHYPTDWLLLSFLMLQILLYLEFVPMSIAIRNVAFTLLDSWLPYFVLSRCLKSKEQVRDAMACFALCMVIFALPTVAEVALGTLLYANFASEWSTPNIFTYLTRGESIRAQLASGQSIVLGYQFAIALGFWCYLQHHVPSRFYKVATGLLLALGLVMPLSRGPWVGAVAIVVVYVLSGPRALGTFVKVVLATFVLAGAISLTPWADQVVQYLPFIGNFESETITYRQLILEVSWRIIQHSPFFGDPYAKLYMESLRTGQGIIDIVNVYVAMTLYYGFVGSGLFTGFFVLPVIALFRLAKARRVDDDTSRMAAVLLAAIVGAMVMIGTVSNYLSIPVINGMLVALAVGFRRIAMQPQTASLSDAIPVDTKAVGRMPLHRHRTT
jgi:O-antigen ligase